MARVTVEDCTKIVKNRFNLVLYAAERTKGILTGLPVTIDKDNDKPPVIALRELASKKILPVSLEEAIIKRQQKRLVTDLAELAFLQERAAELMEELSLNSYGEEIEAVEIETLALETDIEVIEEDE